MDYIANHDFKFLGYWIVAGDFNAIRSNKERKGRLVERQDIEDFNDFIGSVDFVDVRLSGRKFTWY